MGSQEVQNLSYMMKCRINLDGYWEEVPGSFIEMLGYSEEELKELTLADVLHPDNRQKGAGFVRGVREQDHREFEMEGKYQTKSGDVVWAYTSAMMIKNSDGDPQFILCHIHNMTKHKKAQQQLKESEQRFRSLFKHNPLPVYYFDLEGNFEGVNEKLVEFTGYNRNELREMGFEAFIVDKDLERTKQYFQKAADGIAGEYEIQVEVKSGAVRDIKVTKFPMYQGDEVVGVFGILQDLTEQKKARRLLKESEERWQQLVKQNPQPIQITQDADIIFINKAGAELYGADSTEEVIGKSVYDFSDPEKVEQIEERKNRLEQGKPVDEVLEHKINCLDGSERYVEIYSIPTTYQDKVTIQSVFYDVTERKKKERRMLQSLDEKETLLKEIHHRVKNNLAVISGLLELQVLNSEDQSTINILRDSQQRIKSMAMIHEKLYETEALADISFDRYLRELVDSIQQTYSSEEFEVDITYNLDSVSLDLEQAIPCSLIVNEVIVNCYKHAFAETQNGAISLTSSYDVPVLEITIEDNGCGLPKDFDISDQNTLGMNLVQTLAAQLDGNVQFKSEKDTGTTFKVEFETT